MEHSLKIINLGCCWTVKLCGWNCNVRMNQTLKQSVVLYSARSSFEDRKPFPCAVRVFSSATANPSSLRCSNASRINIICGTIRCVPGNVNVGTMSYERSCEDDGNHKLSKACSLVASTSDFIESLIKISFPVLGSAVLLACVLVFSLLAIVKVAPSAVLSAISMSGFIAAFSLILTSELGDKTFFLAALLAMQYEKGLVFLGTLSALSVMTIITALIGHIFHSAPPCVLAMPIGKYAAAAVLIFFGLKSLVSAYHNLPNVTKHVGEKLEFRELTSAEVLLQKNVTVRLKNPYEVVWKTFTLVFLAQKTSVAIVSNEASPILA